MSGQPLRRGEEGFSLLEVLVAMMVLSIGAASVLSLFAAAANTHRRSVDRTRAALIAERLFSEIQGRYTTGLDATKLKKAVEREVPAQFGDYKWDVYLYHPADSERKNIPRVRGPRSTVTAATPGRWQPQELFARVLIRWKRSGNDRAESFFTILLPRNVPGRKGDHESGGRSRRSRTVRFRR